MQGTNELSPVALALGRIPTGLYIVTARKDDQVLGLVASFLVQVGFVPPSVCMAIGTERAHLEAIRGSGAFAISVLDPASSKLMGAFFKQYPPGESAFDHVPTLQTPRDLPVMAEALAWLECKVSGEHPVGDHVVVFGIVEHAALLRDGEPSVHLRKNGLGY